MQPKRIVIIGPESTGKSTLSEQLAGHYGTVWCPEFARNYLLEREGKYTYEDLLTIAQGQLELEDRLAADARNGVYFVDTDMYVMKVWCEVVFGRCHPWILKQAAERHYAFYLLCDTDLPWVADELREYPDLAMRRRLYLMYEDIVINSGVPWAPVHGGQEARLQGAIAAVDGLLAQKPCGTAT
jgi:NadR type nicotinamide-nucleotide adenylyltransferase